MTYRINSTSSENTERLGERVGTSLKGGEVIELVSDLGGGKTTFVCGLVRGAGSSAQVSSPTFALANEYPVQDSVLGLTLSKDRVEDPLSQVRPRSRAVVERIVHFDFYRLGEPGIMADELAEVIKDPRAVVIVEWGEIVTAVLPPKRLTIKLSVTGENSRMLEFSVPASLKYLLPR